MEVLKRIDIINALSCLKAMCLSFERCSNCLAYVDGICKIKYQDPEDYDLNNTGNDVWRAFK